MVDERNSMIKDLCSGQLKLYGSVTETQVEWLWYPYIPFGKVSLLQGDPGCGKSTLMMSIIAAASTGSQMPDGRRLKKPIHVIYQCSEDGMSDTIKPRLLAAGADCNNVAFLDEEMDFLTLNDEVIRRAIADFNAKLLVIDPVQAYLGDNDISNALAMRKMVRQLAGWASLYDCAIVLIGHMNKRQGSKDLYRALGSIDLVASARSVLEVDMVDDDSDIRAFRHIKCSVAPRSKDKFFSIDDNNRIRWIIIEGGAGTHIFNHKGKKTKQDVVAERLLLMLADGPIYSADAMEVFKQDNISEKTVNLVKKQLDIQSFKKDGIWYWKLPDIYYQEKELCACPE